MSTQSSGGAAERFLARVTSYVLEHGYRTPEDFLRSFQPPELMEALGAAPELRKDILVAAGLHEKIARRKSAESAAEDLRIALDEGITTASEVLKILKPEDRARYLNRAKLFAFAVEEGYFSGQKTGSEHERAVDRLLSILDSAIAEGLLSLTEIAVSIGMEPIVHRLPLRELQRALERALTLGSRGEAFTDLAFFETVPLRSILSYVPLDQVWNKVAVPKVLAPLGLAEPHGKLASSTSSSEDVRRFPGQSTPPKPSPVNGRKPSFEAGELLTENEVDTLLENVEKNRESLPSIDADEDIRLKVLERLQIIGRQPPRHAELSTPVLLSIDSMYAELLEAPTDEAREECIRESFPNEQQMTQALLALIELLDPSIDVNEPLIRDAELESLIKVFVFEERHRYEQLHPPQRSSAGASGPPSLPQAAVAPLPPSAMRRTSPPPLPRPGLPQPPPLPSEKR